MTVGVQIAVLPAHKKTRRETRAYEMQSDFEPEEDSEDNRQRPGGRRHATGR